MIQISFTTGTELSFTYLSRGKVTSRQVVVEKCNDAKQLLLGKENGLFKSFSYNKMGQIKVVKVTTPQIVKPLFKIESSGSSVAVIRERKNALDTIRFFDNGRITKNGRIIDSARTIQTLFTKLC